MTSRMGQWVSQVILILLFPHNVLLTISQIKALNLKSHLKCIHNSYIQFMYYNLKASIWVILLIMPRQAPASCEVWQADGGGEIYFNLPPSNDRTSN